MARGRMITNEICRDKDIDRLSNDTSRLAFTWLITFADREGRSYGDPAIVRSMLFPRRDDITIEMMTEYLIEWSRLGLIVWYEAQNDLFIWFPAFEKNQIGLRKSREPASIIPAPPDEISRSLPESIRQSSGILTDDIPVKLIKEKLIKEKLIKGDDESISIFKAYEDNINLLTPMVSEELKSLLNDYPEQWILDAINVAVEQNKRSLAYIKAILRNRQIGRQNGKPKTLEEQRLGGRPLPDGI
jgi:DnaD/phage-associated family protein